MNKITRFDRGTVKALNGEIGVALRPIIEKYGLSVPVVGASYTDTNVRFTVKINTTVTPTGEERDEARDAFIEASKGDWPHVPMVRREWLDEEFTYFGEKFRVVGYLPRSRKRPVLVQDRNAKRYKMSIQMVKDSIDGPTFKPKEVTA